MSGASRVLVRNFSGAKDELRLRLRRLGATSLAELGNLLGAEGTAYAICLYDNGNLVYSFLVPPGGRCGRQPCWKEIKAGNGGYVYRYERPDACNPPGPRGLVLVSGPSGKARLTWWVRGANLSMPPLPMTQPLVAQVRNSAGTCWEALFTAPPLKNTLESFRDKGD